VEEAAGGWLAAMHPAVGRGRGGLIELTHADRLSDPRERGMLRASTSGDPMFIADTDADARRLLQRLLLEMGLSADLDELDRRVAADPAFLQELKARALRYLGNG
jgi:hypothetical protein